MFVCSVIGIISQIYSFPSLTPSCKYVRGSFTDAPVAMAMAKIMKHTRATVYAKRIRRKRTYT